MSHYGSADWDLPEARRQPAFEPAPPPPPVAAPPPPPHVELLPGVRYEGDASTSIASLVLGTIAAVICWITPLYVIALGYGLLGFLLGAPSYAAARRGQRDGRGAAGAGTILSAVALLTAAALHYIDLPAASTVFQQ